MEQIHKDRLLKLAAYIEALPADSFYMPSFVQEWDDENNCPKVACGLGYCPMVFPEEWCYNSDRYGGVRVPALKTASRPTARTVFNDASEFFGLGNDAVCLFHGRAVSTTAEMGKRLREAALA